MHCSRVMHCQHPSLWFVQRILSDIQDIEELSIHAPVPTSLCLDICAQQQISEYLWVCALSQTNVLPKGELPVARDAETQGGGGGYQPVP